MRDRYGRLPRRKRILSVSVDPELHAEVMAAISTSGLSVSAWLTHAAHLKLELDRSISQDLTVR